MTIGTDNILWVEMPGLTEEQVRRALRAAHRSLAQSGFTIDEAYECSWKPELAGYDRKVRMSNRDWAGLRAWSAAIEAAAVGAGLSRESAERLQLFPADVGRPRRDNALRDLVSGRVLEVIPPPDPGPVFSFTSQAA